MITVDEKYLNLTATLCKEVKDSSYELCDITGKSDKQWNILEVGSGTGVDVFKIAELLPNSTVIGLDFDLELIKTAQNKLSDSKLLNVSFVHGNLYDINEISSYDLIRAERVIQHLPDIDRAFDVMYNALKSGGRLTLVDANWSKLECAAFTNEQNKKVQEIYTGQLVNKVNQQLLKEQLERIELIDIIVQSIKVGLSARDYLQATRFREIIVPRLPDSLAYEMLTNIEPFKDQKVCGLIEMVLITGIKK